MQISEIIDLYQYNRWAHERSLDSAVSLTSEQYNRQLGGSYPTLRATFEHLLAAEVIWLSRWEGHSLAESPDYHDCVDVAALRMRWGSYWHRQFRYLESLLDDDLAQLVAIRTRTGIETVQPLSDTLVHVVNHSTYHRGQVASQIRQLGGQPMNTDYFMYCLARDAAPPEAKGEL